MEFVVVFKDTIQFAAFVVNVTGIKSMIKHSESVEYLATLNVSSILPNKPVSVCLNTISCLMEHAGHVRSTLLTVLSLNLVFVMMDIY